MVCVIGELAGPVRVPEDDHHDHGPGAPVQYFTPPAQLASQPSAKSDAPSSASPPTPEVVALLEPAAAVPVAAMASLVPLAAVRPAAPAPLSAVPAAPSAERFVPDTSGEFPEPPYPRWARQQGVQGRMLVLVDVAASGSPSSVVVRESSGHPPLDQHAVDWVRQRWTWAPGAPRRFLVPLVFELQ